MTMTEISGTFDQNDLRRLAFPVAWSGEPDHEYEADLRCLADEGLELLDTVDLATAVEIEDGVIVAVIVAD